MGFKLSLKDLLLNPNKIIRDNTRGTVGKYLQKGDVGTKLFDTLAYGTKGEKIDLKRRWGNAGSGAIGGAVSGAKTGGPWGAVLGAIGGGAYGYQDKRPVTGRRALQKGGVGLGIGYGAGSGVNALTGSGSGWTLGIGSGSSAGSTTGASTGSTLTSKISSLASGMGGGGGQQEQQPSQEMRYQQWLNDMRQKRVLDAQERATRLQRIGGDYAV